MKVGDRVIVLLSYDGNVGREGTVYEISTFIKVRFDNSQCASFNYESSLCVIDPHLPGHGLNNTHIAQELPR
jgi:hypothetical protein